MEVKMKKQLLFLVASVLFSTQLFSGIINVPAFRQDGASWGANTLGTCTGCSLTTDGCAITCVAMLLKTNGVNTDPGLLNTYLKNTTNGYAYNSSGCPGNCLISWTVPTAYTGSSMTYPGLSTTFNLTTVKSEIDNGNPVILQTKSGSITHYVVIKGYNNTGTSLSDYVVVDPLKTGDQVLTNYSTDGVRIYRNVSQKTAATCTFNVSVEGAAQTALTQGWKFWQMTNANFYHVYGTISNLPNGSNYAIWMANEDGTARMPIIGNQSASTFDFGFQIPYNDGGKYTFTFCPQGINTTIWSKSPWFYMSALPTLSISVTPTTLNKGQQATANWTINGGIPTLADGGWTNNIQLQWYQNNTALVNLNQVAVANHSYSFTVPSSISGGVVPGCQFKISGSNPDNTSIKSGYIYGFTNEFCIQGGTRVNDIFSDNFFNIYLTASNDKIIIETPELIKEATVVIYNTKGQEIVRQLITNSKTQIDISNLPSSTYLVKMMNGKYDVVKSFIKK